MLSNIFQNDLHDIFKTGNCDPVVLGDMSLNSLSWADDLMLISTTTEGLQECLNKLYTYCLKWGLEVNVEKTKTMVLYQKKCNLAMPLAFGNSLLENVESYEYLGFKLKYNNDVSHVISDRASKEQTHVILFCGYLERNAERTSHLFMPEGLVVESLGKTKEKF